MWTNLGIFGAFEYWLSPNGTDVYRRRQSEHNVITTDGRPMNVRWDSSLAHFEHYVAGRLQV